MVFASTKFETHHNFHLHMRNMHSFIIIRNLLVDWIRLWQGACISLHLIVIIISLITPVRKTPFSTLIGLKLAIICNIDSFQFLSTKIVPIPIGFRAHITHRQFDNGGLKSRY